MSAATQPHQSRRAGKKDPITGLINAFSHQPLRPAYVRAFKIFRKTSGCTNLKGSNNLGIDVILVTFFALDEGCEKG